ncbi:MAG: sugar-binding domain-containing protein, partial [bacterium]
MILSVCLKDGWKIARDPENRGRVLEWFKAMPESAEAAPVPGIIQQVFPNYHGVAWYWTRFVLPALPGANERLLLRFGAVDYLAEVWVNGVAVGGHEGGETPFELYATAAARAGENLLAVRVLNPGSERIDDLVLGDIPHSNKAVPPAPG